jgi:hypothetical protein
VTTTSTYDAQPAGEDKETRELSSEHDHLLRQLPRWLTLTTGTAVLALATGGVGLVYTFWPGLRPDPRVTKSATLSVVAVDRLVTRKDFEQRNDLRIQEGKATQCMPGKIFYLEERLEGFKGQDTSLQISRYDAKSDAYLGQVRLDRTKRGSQILRGTRPTDQSIQRIWIPWSAENRKVFYRFELYQGKKDDKNLLSLADSRPVRMHTATYTQEFTGCITGG